MYPGRSPEKSAGPTGAEGGAVGLALGVGPFVLHIDFGCAALVVDSVILAVGHIAGNAGVDLAAFLFSHRKASIHLLFSVSICGGLLIIRRK